MARRRRGSLICSGARVPPPPPSARGASRRGARGWRGQVWAAAVVLEPPHPRAERAYPGWRVLGVPSWRVGLRAAARGGGACSRARVTVVVVVVLLCRWGKPPVNESGQPLYGDVFGNAKVRGARPRSRRLRPRHARACAG